MASALKNLDYSPKFYSVLITVCLAQVTLSDTLGRDTLQTITANETYELGYRTTKSQQDKTCFYSASSGLGLIRLAKLESQIYNAAVHIFSKAKASRETHFKKLIQEYLDDYNATSSVIIKKKTFTGNEIEAAKVAEDLIGTYNMVRRFRNHIQQGLWEALASLQASSTKSSNIKNEAITSLKPLSGQGPFKRDMQLTMFAIIYTQLQYGWTPHNISIGAVQAMELGTTLRAVHCIELGVHAVASGIYSVGIDWLELAVIKIQNGDKSAELKLTLDLLQKAKAKHDKLWRPLTSWTVNATFFTKRLNDMGTIDSREWQRSIVFDTSEDVPEYDEGEDDSWEICTGRLKQTEKTKSKLFCWHETTVDPSWKIRPLKVELLANDPYQVVQFHDVLGSSKVKQINTKCDTVLETSNLLVRQTHFDPKLRLGEDCFRSFRQLERLSQRITGLVSAAPGKIIPVGYYPPGGHIRSHVDNTGLEGFRQRIATVIYYLDGPEFGGELAFPLARVAGKPIKGSAILWYNLLKSSEFDFGTLHASCPVVKGRKTIATDWIAYRAQAHLTCDKDSGSKMKFIFNGKENL